MAGVHAVVCAEVAADHEGFCRGAVAGQGGGFVRHVGAVLAVVDADFAEVTVPGLIRLVEGRGPVAAFAEALLGGRVSLWFVAAFYFFLLFFFFWWIIGRLVGRIGRVCEDYATMSLSERWDVVNEPLT